MGGTHIEGCSEDCGVLHFVVQTPIEEVVQLAEVLASHRSVLVVYPGDRLVGMYASM